MREISTLKVSFFLALALLVLGFWMIPHNVCSLKRSRERVLRQNLFTLRSLIQQYSLDKHKDPQSLQDLVTAGYLKEIPKDPMTGNPDWRIVRYLTAKSTNGQNVGIEDIQSSSPALATDGSRYNSW